METSTRSPAWSGSVSVTGSTPSILKPTSMKTCSGDTATTVPSICLPRSSGRRACVRSYSVKSASNDSFRSGVICVSGASGLDMRYGLIFAHEIEGSHFSERSVPRLLLYQLGRRGHDPELDIHRSYLLANRLSLRPKPRRAEYAARSCHH